LAPEHGRNLEFGLKFNAGMSDATITAYRNRVTDLIIFGAAGACQSAFGCYQNVSQAVLQGVSLSGGTQFGPTRLSATLDLQAPKDASTGKLLARRARNYGTVRADTQFANLANWKFGVGVQASGQRYDNAGNTAVLAGYALLNLDVQYTINRELKLQFNLDNAFDRTYQVAGGYAQAPRTVMLGLRYSPSL
jgi:vitamin B12 transporter